MAIEWKYLSDVCSVHTGMQLNRDDMLEEGLYPVLNGGRTPSGYTNSANEKANSITISQGGESAGFVNWIDTDFWAGAHCYVFRDLKISKRYLYHILKNREEQIRAKRQGAGIPGLNRNALMRLSIPVPHKDIQDSLVSKLDTFTSLISKIDEEIELRKKQYVYYRNQLLDIEYEEGVEMKSLGEIACKITSGKNKSKSPEGPYPVFGSTGIIAYTETYLYDSPLILVARVGANAGYVHMSYGKYDVTDNTLIVDLKKTVEQKYVYYVLIKEEINKFAKGGGQPLITSSILKHVMIPVPSLKKQQSIVKKLDAFTSLISKLQEERDLRQKQYEYYREKLLTFD